MLATWVWLCCYRFGVVWDWASLVFFQQQKQLQLMISRENMVLINVGQFLVYFCVLKSAEAILKSTPLSKISGVTITFEV